MNWLHISGSNGENLVFPDEELLGDYRHAEELLLVQTYKKIRDKYGIFAGNQNKFVRGRDDMNKLDSMYMENLYDKHYDNNRAMY